MNSDEDTEIIHRELSTEREYPATQIAEIVADLDDSSVRALPSMFDCVDDVLEHLFTNPPSPEAQLQVTFSYEGYRITVEQDGRAKFVRPG